MISAETETAKNDSSSNDAKGEGETSNLEPATTEEEDKATAVNFAHDSDLKDKTLKQQDEKVSTDKVKTSSPAEATNASASSMNRNSVAEQWRRANSQRRGCRQRNPRCWAFVVSIIGPLWILIGVSLLGGRLLAKFEAPEEYILNDRILANRAALELLDFRGATRALLELPLLCYEQYLKEKFTDKTNITLPPQAVKPIEKEEEEDANVTATVTILQNDGFGLDDFAMFVHGLYGHMEDCGDQLVPLLDKILEIQEQTNALLGFQPLTFNWVRCWNESEVGSRQVRRPTKEQIRAAAVQAPYYEAVWQQDQEMLFDMYLEDITDGNPGNATGDERAQAFNMSIREATGRTGCSVNAPGTAWFWFTIMTTVGYGNQAPITSGGRTMVALLGFVSIVVFAGILANAGSIVNVIWDDAVGRAKKYPFLKSPGFGCLFWASITTVWLWFLSGQVLRWWTNRLDGEFEVSKLDSVWWAFITTTTVGLGDYFLQPEVIFAEDVFRFSFLVLCGFVFLATFLGQFSALVSPYFADAGDSLKTNLEDTRLLYQTFEQVFGGDGNKTPSEGNDANGDGDADGSKGNVDLDRTTVATLEKLLQDQVKRDEEESQKNKQDSSLLEDEEVTLKQLWKLKKAQQLRLLQEEEALLRQLIENNGKQQQRQAASSDESEAATNKKHDAPPELAVSNV